MSKAIGIDLGSTLSEVSVIENGKPVVIVNDEGSATTPSIVSFKEDTPKVGASAKRQMVMSPKETVNLVKRFMGGTYDEVKDAIEHVQYDVKNVNGKPYVNIKGRDYTPEEISSYILTKMKKVAEDYLGEKVDKAVITVPAFFSDAAKAATKQAGELAGLEVLRIIAEPTSALLASNIDKAKGGKYLVVDFGGSTTDNSVADISDNVIEILSSYGDVYLGGSDIDKVVSDYIVNEFKQDKGVDLSKDNMAMTRVIESAEKAKIELSTSGSTEINLPYITVVDNVPQHLVMTLTKAKFEQLIAPIIKRVVDCGKEALKKADVTASELDGVLLVGGSCRIPLLQEELIKAFGDKLIKSANLDTVVAEGAAIQSDILVGGKSDILLLDVTPLGLGIETMGGVMTQIVEANTTIPCKRSQIFTTAQDNQPAVTINCLQGQRPMAKDNKTVGVFNLDGIAPARRGIPQIEVTFDIDANGILTVTATDKATGKEQHITVENNNSLSKEEIERIKREAEEHAAEDAKAKELLERNNKIDSAIYQTENMMEEFKDKPDVLTEEDKSFFNEKIETLNKQKNGEIPYTEDVLNEIQQRWYTVSGKAYAKENPNATSSNPFGQGFNMNDFAQNFGGGGNPFANQTTSNSNTNNDTDFEEVK